MSEDNHQNLVQQKNCCRLCLAPNSECISIINSFAADKEPLIKKIQNCVSIKISSTDRLSLCICHACISYLNSWQSFKNRCLSAQVKQLSWLDKSKLTDIDFSAQQQHQAQQHQNDEDKNENSSLNELTSNILDGISTLKKRKSLTVYSLPAVQVKEEPLDEPDEYDIKHDESDDMMVDPTMFLERTAEVGDEPIMEPSGGSGPFDYGQQQQQQQQMQVSLLPQQSDSKEASCRACNLKFSTRANARRHERNLHPNLFELKTDSSNNTVTTKPIPALAAALELQRAAAHSAALEASKIRMSPQKFRQEVLNAVNKVEIVEIDYEHPEKYQHLLSDEKIIFIQQNEEFLQQYQTMTCRCCDKFFNTYKNFMAHMRKKYPALPRNLCFNCLKLNYSKALFISHLKKRNCVNMYKVMHSLMAKSPSFAAAVNASVASTTEKLRAKELLVNKMYECKLCAKHFRLKHEFRSHVYEKHSDAQRPDTDGSQCSFCGLESEDPVERKRHNNNMDCLVTLCCLTCDTKFDGNQKFLDHVQETHLKVFEQQQEQNIDFATALSMGRGSSASTDDTKSNSATNSSAPKGQYFSRMPQACPICGQRYNNYNNVLRHMESKHPDQLPQTYKCVKCGIGYPRLSNLREHMSTVHQEDKARHSGFEYIVNSDATTKIKDNKSSAYSGRYDYVMKDLMSITNGGNLEEHEDDSQEQSAKKMRLDNSPLKNEGFQQSTIKTCPLCSAVFNNNIGLSNHMRSHAAANQNAMAALTAATRTTPKSLTITPVPASASTPSMTNTPNELLNQTPEQQLSFKRSLEQAADRRFRRMRCRLCQKRFSSKKSYRAHMLNDHNVQNVQFIKCKLCSAEFAQEKGLKVHMFKIHNTLLKEDSFQQSQFECDVCSIVYRSEEQLLQHKKTVHNLNHLQSGDMESSLSGAMDAASGSADVSGFSTPVESGASNGASGNPPSAPLYWYQCKYCPSNFNTNKKLAIHINSHDEFDSNDYSCKDCGNVYSGRKSLWVHRYKKHPQIPDPSECLMCKKVFFDAQMLENHIPTCNRKIVTPSGAIAPVEASASSSYKHKTGDDEEDDDSRDVKEDSMMGSSSGVHVGTLGGGQVDVTAMNAGSLKIKLPEVACTMCGARFSDQDLFTQHIKKHELELYTDNPLAAMFDTEPADPHQFFLDRVNENGDYACDLCSKVYNNVVALKVHRKWHFRGDSKQNANNNNSSSNSNHHHHHKSEKKQNNEQQVPTPASVNTTTPMNNPLHHLGLQAVGLIPKQAQTNPQQQLPKLAVVQPQQLCQDSSTVESLPLYDPAMMSGHPRAQKKKRELKCDYCVSTFISNNNLRRHLYELHKDEIGHLPQPPRINCDPNLECRRCDLKFNSKQEWIEHKVNEARLMKPFGPFQWGCDLCGLYVSRKEKLINHINNHMKEAEIVPVQQNQQQDGSSPNNNNNINHNNNRDGGGSLSPSSFSEQRRAQFNNDSREGNMEAMDISAEAENEMDAENDQGDDDDEDDNDQDDESDSDSNSEASTHEGEEEEASDEEDDEEEREDIDEEEEGEDDSEEEQQQRRASPSHNRHNLENRFNHDNNDADISDNEDEDRQDDDDDDDDSEDGTMVIEEQVYDDDDDDDDEESDEPAMNNGPRSPDTTEAEDSPSFDEDSDVDEAGDDDSDGDHRIQRPEIVPKKQSPQNEKSFCCDLCSARFDGQMELQKHVKMHFLQGPTSVSLSKASLKRSSSSSSGNDLVTVNSS